MEELHDVQVRSSQLWLTPCKGNPCPCGIPLSFHRCDAAPVGPSHLFFDKRRRAWQRAPLENPPDFCDGGRGVAKPEWGVKRICPSCGARYYDMRKDPPVCPSCGAQFDPEALLKSRKARPAPADDTKKVAAVTEDEDTESEAEAETPELEDVEDDMSVDDIEEADDTAEDEDDVLIEDTSELGEDDMDEVVDVEGEDEEER